MNLSTNIKQLRRKADLTQEQLAEVLGISFQSVSKWERNEGMPDITLLPSMARFFNTTVDDLLNMDEDRQLLESKELDETLAETDTSDINSIYDDIVLLRKHVKKYPLDWEKQIQLSWYIFSCEGKGDPEKAASINKSETVEILQKVVEYCDNMNIKARATDFLVCALSHLKLDNDPISTEKLNKLTASLPTARYSQEMIALQANKNTKSYAVAAAQAHIAVLREIFILLVAYGTADDKIRINKAEAALENLMNNYVPPCAVKCLFK
jgi:transcriptional regulator with XRE-family HTH domain